MKNTHSQTFAELYKELFSEWTRRNRREAKRLSESIQKKLKNGKTFTEDENALYYKVEMYCNRQSFTEEAIPEILKQISDSDFVAGHFAKDPSKQNISESAQKKHMELRSHKIEKLPSSGTNSLRFCSQNKTLVSKKIEGGTSRSFDFIKEYGQTVEYFLGKVCWGQGGHQNGVKNEIVNFLKSANKFLENNPDSNMVFTALVDGDAVTYENVREYHQYTNSRVRFFNSDEYEPFS